jgi:hypothetical protein
MSVRGPANRASAVLHDRETVGIRQCKVLISKSGKYLADFGQLTRIEPLHGQPGEGIDKSKELGRPVPVISPKKPTMPFRYHQSGSHQSRRRREKPLE